MGAHCLDDDVDSHSEDNWCAITIRNPSVSSEADPTQPTAPLRQTIDCSWSTNIEVWLNIFHHFGGVS